MKNAVARNFQWSAHVEAVQPRVKYDNGALTLNLPKKVNKAAWRLNIEYVLLVDLPPRGGLCGDAAGCQPQHPVGPRCCSV